MKLKYYNKIVLATLVLSFLMSSCRSVGSDSPENITDPRINTGDASVVVNLLGSEFEGPDGNSPKAFAGKQLRNPQATEIYYTLTSPSTLLAAEVSEDTSVPLKTSAGVNPAAVIDGLPLALGDKFRLIAYRMDGSYAGYKDFTVGVQSTTGGLRLPKDVLYWMVVYSYGTSNLPGISPSETMPLGNAKHTYDNMAGQNGFLHQVQMFTPREGDNIMDVTLMHKIAQVTTKINSSALSGSNNITLISSATLKGNNRNAEFKLSDGSATSRSSSQDVGIALSPPQSLTEWVSNAVFINADSGGNNKTISFSADVAVNFGTAKSVTVNNGFSIKPGYRTTYKINLKEVTCGAKINNVFREFACYNQGATKNGKPFIPAKEIHGSKYQWDGTELIQSADWGGNLVLTETPFKTSVTSTAAAMKLPCDEGYRVPTSAEWESLINENTLQGIGTPNNNSIYVFDVGMQILEKGVDNPKVTLMLPHAGYRTIEDYTAVGGGTVKHSQINKRGTTGSYWSSSSNNNYTHINGLYLNYNPSGKPPSFGNISGNLKSNVGTNLRCIKN
ncbi:fimbrillin family protein [Elizabethkingia miricola]|uniref:fimbrillin family protein n=1 Tax=Elizabethkingia miricola TaxID=172045 RepID=UPI0009990794|nr:fimbrillin family protein [Elizabethkingia miricola]OPC34959.1 hypothetical protein BAX99_07955 [Elizabethkingia miricola]